MPASAFDLRSHRSSCRHRTARLLIDGHDEWLIRRLQLYPWNAGYLPPEDFRLSETTAHAAGRPWPMSVRESLSARFGRERRQLRARTG